MKSWLGATIFLAGVVAMAGSAIYSLAIGEGEWFQRSGSLMVLSSGFVEIKQQKEETHVRINGRPVYVEVPVSTSTRTLYILPRIGLVIGTVVWGYGDLLF